MLSKRYFTVLLLVVLFTGGCGKNRDKVLSLPEAPWKSADKNVSVRPEFKYLIMVLSRLWAYFYDPEAINPREMLNEGLDKLQSSVASVMVHQDGDSIEVQVDKSRKSFSIKGLKDVGDLAEKSRKIIGFVLDELARQGVDHEEQEDAFYSFVNGMLDAVDPFSMLIRPKYIDDLTMQTRGEYGGVGMVLSIRDWELTVIAPISGTPASKAGIKAGDKILQIDDQSTVNMPLTDAVDMIRGPKGTKVRLLIKRKGWSEPREFTLTREKIKLRSVSGKLLPGKIAYLRINQFIGGTNSDLRNTWKDLKKQAGGSIRGVILDLWDNPGGLLNQAIGVADDFLDKGMIVATVGAPGTQRREAKAHKNNTLSSTIPMVVLVSNGSASASEIVSGTLKNLDRALLMGRVTFGKGTVQQIFPPRSEGAPSLKLTVREYLTAGDVSIQSVGVVPHVRVVPVGIVDGVSAIFWADEPRKVSDRKHRRHSRYQRPPEKPAVEIRYWKSEVQKKEYKGTVDETGADPELVELARQVLDRFGRPKGSETLQAAMSFLKERAIEESRRMETALRKKGVDFSGKFTGTGASVKLDVALCLPDGAASKDATRLPEGAFTKCGKLELLPGQESRIRLTLSSSTPIGPLYAVLRSPFEYLDGTEFIFGHVSAGASRTWTAPFKLARYIPAGVEPFTVEVYGRGHVKVGEFGPYLLTIKKIPTPAFSLHVEEKDAGNGSRMVHAVIKNIGPGASDEAVVVLRNKSGKSIFIEKGRQILKNVPSGQGGEANLRYTIRKQRKNLKMEAAVYDYTFRKGITKAYTVPLEKPITIVAPSVSFPKMPPAITSSDTVTFTIRVSHLQEIRDVYVTVTNDRKEIYSRKVFYRVVHASGGTFQVKVPVYDGVNRITVTARRDRDLMGYESVYVVRQAAASK